jgi:NarL family two-component system response regulator YdfI
MTRVFIIAPTPMMQAGLHALLTHPDLQIVGTAPTLEAPTVSLEEVDVVIIADELQVGDAGPMFARFPQIASVVLTDNAERVVPMLQTWDVRSWGIVPLDAPAEQLQAAVVGVAQGLVVVPHTFASVLSPERRTAAVERVILEGTDESLTPREREVLELVSQGLSNKLIARRLHISEHTVKFHISSITGKLGASSRTDAVRRGLSRGLITL